MGLKPPVSGDVSVVRLLRMSDSPAVMGELEQGGERKPSAGGRRVRDRECRS